VINESRRSALHIAYVELQMLYERLLDLHAAGGAARRKVTGNGFLEDKRVASRNGAIKVIWCSAAATSRAV
jgi:hypothetical protein